MKFDQFLEQNMRNIFLVKSYTKYSGQIIYLPFFKNIKIEYISGSTVWTFTQIIFIICAAWGLPKYIETKGLNNCYYLIKSCFRKTKRGLELISLSRFRHEKIFLTLYFFNWLNFIVWLPFVLGILGNLYIIIICFLVCHVIDFEVILLVCFRRLKWLALRVTLYCKI